MAFAVGYMTHAAGDMYAHTFVNNFSGGHFTYEPPINAIKHILLEKYIDKKAPTPIYDVSIAGVENFIYNYTINAAPGSYLDKELLVKGDKNTNFSIPRIYSTLRAELQSNIDAYYAKIEDFNRRIDDKLRAADDCELLNFSCSAIALRTQATLIESQKAVYRATYGLIITYQEHWRDDIDTGLKAWPGVSHEVAKALFFNTENKGKVDEAEKILVDYVTNHLISMSGTPDVVGNFAGLYNQVFRIFPKNIQDSLDQINPVTKVKNKIYDFVIKEATGMTRENLKKYLSSPETYFDEVMTQGPGENIDCQTFNTQYLRLNNSSCKNNTEKFDYRKFPAAYNTVTMSKLTLMSTAGVNQLLGKLNDSLQLNESNIMLGFINTLDGDNEWSGSGNPKHKDKKMVLAHNCGTYTQVFMKQPGDEASPCKVDVKPALEEVCFDVNSQKPWQYYTLPASFTRITSVSETWSVDAKTYSRVGAEGHSEPGLEPYNQYKYDQGHPFGTLLVDIPDYGYVGINEGQELPRPITETSMRINDGDNALGDNIGALKVCFGRY